MLFLFEYFSTLRIYYNDFGSVFQNKIKERIRINQLINISSDYFK